MNRNKYTMLLIAVLTLTGCDTLIKDSTDKQEKLFPANLTARCPKIPNITVKPVNMGNLMEYTTDLMGQYNECALRHDGLIDIIEKNGTTNKQSK